MKGALLLVAVAVGAGCANDNLSISIIAMEAVTQSNMCVATATAGGTTLTHGTLDVSLVTTQGYVAVPLIRNNLVASTTTGSGMFEFNSITITGANIELQTVAGAPLSAAGGQQSFYYPSSGIRLDPSASGAIFVEVLRSDVVKALAGMIPANGVFTVIAKIRPVGMKGDTQVVGEAMPYPIDLCSGCLLGTVPACPLPKGTVAVTNCFPQQDFKNTCCNQAGTLLCGAQAPVATM